MENFKNEKVLVVIPARGGSKRIPKKNIKPICGMPMIFWPLRELSKLFSKKQILVSTDDDEIISELIKWGIKVPFKRPKELSDDFTGTTEVAQHAHQWFELNIEKVDYVLIVYPTAVMLSYKDIQSAFETLQRDRECKSVFSATTFPFPIQRSVFLNKSGFAEMYEPHNYHRRSQDLPDAYHDAGQFYFCRSQSIRSGLNPFDGTSKMQFLHRRKVIDIDTLEDLEVAEIMMKVNGFDNKKMDWTFSN